MKFLKIILILLVVLVIVAFIIFKVMSKDLPAGESGSAADALANEMLSNLNKPAYDQLQYLSWEFFRPGQKYFWDKKTNQAIIEWSDNKVIMNLNEQTAVSYAGSVKQEGEQHEKLKAKAWSNWCNDSFWMIAPYKLFDPGTTREIVDLPGSDNQGLKVTYKGGGVTPGDSYLWVLDKNRRPVSWQMWTSILPVQGMNASWEGWEEHGGAWFSTAHKMASMNMKMKNLKASNVLSDFGYAQDPFVVAD